MQVPDRPPTKRKTVKDVARQVEMSERNVYKHREIIRLGRTDLIERMNAGELSLHAAWLAATGRQRPSSRDRLWSAWAAASVEEKAEFVVWIWDQFDDPPEC
ncbi:hypothetical protein [Aliihoeflea sp. 2WW]|uniref:hypothetical protein n=1 Tax=Aliihoeflea sp. 2WW TaxID=1381123 RepID=UPI001268C112|nr:hypothetical protein [Aliihoeflea sp. 2WW]